ncbi:MAG: CHAT domain-containing protein [Cyclobacteriaceae bacterium]|nr:CHAT domain-containing protein [Cyclobacteriaceae bacterium]
MGYCVRFITICFLFFLNAIVLMAQGTYTLRVSSQSVLDPYDQFGLTSKPLSFNWTVESNEDIYVSSMKGRLVIIASEDSILTASDKTILDSLCTLLHYSYQDKSVRHSLKAGTYYLFTTFYASDQKTYTKQSNTVRNQIQLFDFNVSVSDAWFSHLKVSEYSEETTVHLEVNLNTSCCLPQLGKFSSQWDVGLAKNASSKPVVVQSFYRSDSLINNKTSIILEESIFGAPEFDKFKFMVIKLSSAYFSEGYRTVPDWTVTLPLKVIRNPEELNKVRRKQYPFLTYGDFTIPPDSLSKLPVDRLYEEANQVYKLIASTLELTKAGKLKEAMQVADSAFAFVGNHRASSLLYAEPGLVANIYSGLFKWTEANQLGTKEDKIDLNFRLGEAMKMEELMKTGYQKLITTLLPDTLSLLSSLEESGYYDQQDAFRQPVITELPILWRERSVPALEHFIRSIDFETADQIVSQVDQHVEMVRPIWQLITSDTSLTKHFVYLANSLSEQNDMMNFELTKLKFFAEAGLYEDGEQAVIDAGQAFACSYQFVPTDLWLSTARFYESLGAYEKADSLFKLCDEYYNKKIDGYDGNKAGKLSLTLKTRNRELLHAKLNKPDKNTKAGLEIAEGLEEMRKEEGTLFQYLDLLSDRTLAQKAGFLQSPVYPNFYLNQIRQLEDQGKYFLANEWSKELAFFLGRDGRHKQALILYKNLFPIENLKAMAFRLGFSEEAQIFYSQKQQETFSRFLNVVLDYKSIASPQQYDSLLTTALTQVLFNHSFILRGNFRLLYDVSRSNDPLVGRLHTVWQTLREYLNELYIKEELDKKGMIAVKKQILETEKEMIRLSRDTSSMRLDYIPSVDSIRKNLGDREAAIEIIRYQENYKAYYGKKIKYAALIVKKSAPLELIPFPFDGELMESKHYSRYRNSIRFKLSDEASYDVFWKPLVSSLEGIQKIYWAPDGVFHLINPNTLLNPETKKYLVDEIQIHTVPTLAQLDYEVPLTFSTATILGNPLYGEHAVKNKQDSARTSREYLTSEAITMLPGTKTEAETIAMVLRKNNSKVTLLTDVNATKQSIFKSNQTDVLHLATHGFWLDKLNSSSGYHNLFESLSGSGLILAGAQRKTEQSIYQLLPQGILTSAEIQDMNLFRTKLVVLSACETGLGEVVPGEGIYGLKRALQKAGVQNAITSLWKVDDEATMEFMTKFYQMLIETQNLSLSFQDAMSSLKKKFPEPYYWGAFILTAN